MSESANRKPDRYGDVAVGFHWLIAALVLGLLAVGKYMVGLDESDPQRNLLTQWHKSFGISVLVLSVLRLLWRWTHAAPAHPPGAPGWEKLAANLSHLVLYALLFALPISGWILVSVSPLNIDTLLFDVIPLPHLPPFADWPDKEALVERYAGYHELAGHALIALLLLHAGAALKHHLHDRDDVLRRMLPVWSSPGFQRVVGVFTAVIAVFGIGLYAYASAERSSAELAAGASQVSFVARVSGSDEPGRFTESTVEASIDQSEPGNSQLEAVVQTASVASDNPQLSGTLPDAEWFGVDEHPEARFVSTSITADDNEALLVAGDLTIKSKTVSVEFPLQLIQSDDQRQATGEFTIDRRDFDIGMASQADDGTVAYEVVVRFQFEVSQQATQE